MLILIEWKYRTHLLIQDFVFTYMATCHLIWLVLNETIICFSTGHAQLFFYYYTIPYALFHNLPSVLCYNSDEETSFI